MKVADYYKIRCKCSKCGKTQVRKISDLISGAGCFIGGIGKAQCAGTLQIYTDDAEDSILNTANLLGYLNTELPKNSMSENLSELVDTVADDISCWLERNQTPQEMGWVGQNGLP